jgi:plastocyanin
MLRVRRNVAPVIVLVLGVAACGSTGSAAHSQPAGRSTRTAAPTTHTAPASRVAQVTIGGFAFQPPAITVASGGKVTFVNYDQTAHTATATAQPGFDTGTVKPGRRRTITLTKPGTYAYYCQFHAFMHGTIVVK